VKPNQHYPISPDVRNVSAWRFVSLKILNYTKLVHGACNFKNLENYNTVQLHSEGYVQIKGQLGNKKLYYLINAGTV